MNSIFEDEKNLLKQVFKTDNINMWYHLVVNSIRVYIDGIIVDVDKQFIDTPKLLIEEILRQSPELRTRLIIEDMLS